MKHGRTHTAFAGILVSVFFAAMLVMVPATPVMAASFVYVGNGGGGGNIAVIDANPASPTFNTVVATVANAPGADNLALTPDGLRGYAINCQNGVLVFDTNPSSATFNTVLTTITLPPGPPFFGCATAVAITPSGSRAYAGSSWDPTSGDAFDSVIDTVPTSSTYNTVLATIGTGFHQSTNAIAITPDGSRAYMTGEHIFSIPSPFPSCNNTPCVYGNAIEVVDTATNGLSAFLTPSLNCTTSGVVITPDGSRAYVTDNCQLNVVDLSSNTVTTIPFSGPLPSDTGLAITPDGSHAYLSAHSQTEGLVLVVDTNPASPTYNTIVSTIDLGVLSFNQPQGIGITSDGTLAYVAVAGIPAVDVINTSTNAVVATIPLASGGIPSAVAITSAPAYSGGQLVFAPKSWDFGAVKIGMSVTRKFNIANGSQTQALQVDVLPAAPNPPYSLLSGGGMATIGAGQSEQIVVQFKPTMVTATSVAGSVPITSSDPNRPSASIPLSGRGK
jgi:DNA-binding beta-propeller fold protein YncE